MSLIERPSRWCLIFVAAFIIVTVMMMLGMTLAWDTRVLLAIGPSRNPFLINLAALGQVLGDGEIEIPLVVALGLLFWKLGHIERMFRYLFASGTAQALYMILKPLIHRARPEIIPHLGTAGWYSYPSGHAMLAPIVWGFGLLLLSRSITQPLVQRLMLAGAVILPVWIAIARVYLGVHYPSDVLGAAFLGVGWVLLWREPSSSSSNDATSLAPATR